MASSFDRRELLAAALAPLCAPVATAGKTPKRWGSCTAGILCRLRTDDFSLPVLPYFPLATLTLHFEDDGGNPWAVRDLFDAFANAVNEGKIVAPVTNPTLREMADFGIRYSHDCVKVRLLELNEWQSVA